jgi:hypothetical protein
LRHRRVLKEILRALEEIRYGSVEIVIHDSRVVQIERREKVRLGPADETRPTGA